MSGHSARPYVDDQKLRFPMTRDRPVFFAPKDQRIPPELQGFGLGAPDDFVSGSGRRVLRRQKRNAVVLALNAGGLAVEAHLGGVDLHGPGAVMPGKAGHLRRNAAPGKEKGEEEGKAIHKT